MPNTSNFGFNYPVSTDFVKDGAQDIQALADGIDARFGASAFPNQIVNVVSGLSRPVPFATQTGSASCSYASSTFATATVTFAVSRFTVGPIVTISVISTTPASLLSVAKAVSISAASFTARVDNPSSFGSGTAQLHWHAIQMTSTSGAG